MAGAAWRGMAKTGYNGGGSALMKIMKKKTKQSNGENERGKRSGKL